MLRWCLVIFAADGGLSSARLHQSISASSRGSDSEERVGGADAVVQQDPTTSSSTATHLQQRQRGHLRKRGAKYAAAPSPGTSRSQGLVEENKQKSSNGAEFDAGGGLDVTFTKDEEAGAGEKFGETDPDEVASVGVEGDASFLGGCCGDDKPESGDDKPESGDDKPESGDDKPESGDDKPEESGDDKEPEKAKSETEEESDSGAGAAPDEKSDEKPEPAPAPPGTKASVKAELKLYVRAQLSKRLARIAKKLESRDADQKELAELNKDEKAKRERIKRRLDNFMLEVDIERENEVLLKQEKELDRQRKKKNNKMMVEMAKSDRDATVKMQDDNVHKAEQLKRDLALVQLGKFSQSKAFTKGGNGRAWVARGVRKIAVKTEPGGGNSVVDMNEGRGVPLADHFLDAVGDLIINNPLSRGGPHGCVDFDMQCPPLPDDWEAPAKKSVEAEVEEALLEYVEDDFVHMLEHKKGEAAPEDRSTRRAREVLEYNKRKEERKR